MGWQIYVQMVDPERMVTVGHILAWRWNFQPLRGEELHSARRYELIALLTRWEAAILHFECHVPCFLNCHKLQRFA